MRTTCWVVPSTVTTASTPSSLPWETSGIAMWLCASGSPGSGISLETASGAMAPRQRGAAYFFGKRASTKPLSIETATTSFFRNG